MPREAIMMVANRNVRVASLTGHIIIFERNKPIQVPAEMIPDCMAVGVIPADIDDTTSFSPEEPVIPAVPRGVEREEQLRNAINAMRERNERGDFTGAGRPDLRVLGSLVGFKPDRHEVENLWAKMREEEGSALEA